MMKHRCQDAATRSFNRYGGRGITFDPTWEDVRIFIRDVGGSWFPGAQLHRVDVDKGYSKENCEWLGRNEHAQLHGKLRRRRVA
jgi:hypothetical protein